MGQSFSCSEVILGTTSRYKWANLTEHGQVDTGIDLHGTMDFVNLAKFHSKLALSFHSKACSHPAATEREVHPFLVRGISSTLFQRHSVMDIHPYDRWLSILGQFRPVPRVIISRLSLRTFPGVAMSLCDL